MNGETFLSFEYIVADNMNELLELATNFLWPFPSSNNMLSSVGEPNLPGVTGLSPINWFVAATVALYL